MLQQYVLESDGAAGASTSWAEYPHPFEFIIELSQVRLVISVREELAAVSLADVYCLGGVLRQACVEQIGPNDDGCSTLARVAVDENLVPALRSTLNNNMVHDLYNLQDSPMVWHLQILPVQIIVLNAGVHQSFWSIGKPSARNDPIAAVRMLSWLLKVDHGGHAFLLELLYDVELLDQSIREPLRANE